MSILLGFHLIFKEPQVLHASSLFLHFSSLLVLLSSLLLKILLSLLLHQLSLSSLRFRDRKVLKMLLEDLVLPLRCVPDLVLEPDIVVSEHVGSHSKDIFFATRLWQHRHLPRSS